MDLQWGQEDNDSTEGAVYSLTFLDRAPLPAPI